VATLVVRGDGSHRITGIRRVVDIHRPMLHSPGPRLVSFHDDPVTWARSLPRNLTNPDLYAVVVADDHDVPGVGPADRSR
jgi:hypothetical protein